MANKSSWQSFFDGHAPVYMDNSFTANTLAEVDFLVRELRLRRGNSVLDIGCGTGRHAVELARRSFTVTGVDLSPGMLAQARRHAQEAGVELTLIQADAARMRVPQHSDAGMRVPGQSHSHQFDARLIGAGRFDARQPSAGQFDGVICLCEGAFGLLGRQDDPIEQPLAILRRAARALKPGGRCLFTVLNGYSMARRHSPADVEKGVFDPLTLSEVSEVGDPADPGAMRERAFVPTELRLLFRIAGLDVRHIWGGTAGAWNKGPVTLDEWEIMVVGQRRPAAAPRS